MGPRRTCHPVRSPSPRGSRFDSAKLQVSKRFSKFTKESPEVWYSRLAIKMDSERGEILHGRHPSEKRLSGGTGTSVVVIEE